MKRVLPIGVTLLGALVIGFALVLPDEARTAPLDLFRQDTWQEMATDPVLYPGWDAHFRIEPK